MIELLIITSVSCFSIGFSIASMLTYKHHQTIKKTLIKKIESLESEKIMLVCYNCQDRYVTTRLSPSFCLNGFCSQVCESEYNKLEHERLTTEEKHHGHY